MSTAIGTVGEGSLQRRAAQIRAEMESNAQSRRKPAGPDAAPSAASDDAPDIRPAAPRANTANANANPPESEAADAAPVGGGERVVGLGECISSIAKDTGHFWKTIWDEAANVVLRSERQDPNVLLPGDRVHVPPLRKKYEPGETEMRHRFVRKGWPEVLRLRMLRDDEPRADEPYTLTIDGHETTGVTDAGGNIACAIAPNARRAVLRVGTEPDVEVINLTLGGINPVSAMSGVQARLNNLGFDSGPVDNIWGPRTRGALLKFQSRHGLPETGRADDATRKKLQDEYGC